MWQALLAWLREIPSDIRRSIVAAILIPALSLLGASILGWLPTLERFLERCTPLWLHLASLLGLLLLLLIVLRRRLAERQMPLAGQSPQHEEPRPIIDRFDLADVFGFHGQNREGVVAHGRFLSVRLSFIRRSARITLTAAARFKHTSDGMRTNRWQAERMPLSRLPSSGPKT